MSKPRKLAPIHPGEALYQDFMKTTATSINRLALKLHVPVTRVAEIIKGERSVTADTALRLARQSGNNRGFLDEPAGAVRSGRGGGPQARPNRARSTTARSRLTAVRGQVTPKSWRF